MNVNESVLFDRCAIASEVGHSEDDQALIKFDPLENELRLALGEKKAEQPSSPSPTKAVQQDKVPTQFEHLVKEIVCPISGLPLYQAVTLIPCCDKVNLIEAVASLGSMKKDVALSGHCPVCQEAVEAYYPDCKIRSLADSVNEAKQEKLKREQKYQEAMLDLAARIAKSDPKMGRKIASLPLIEWLSKKLCDEISCPVELSPMISAVTLVPCCHKLSQEALDKVSKGKSQFSCPLCQVEISKTLPDKKWNSLAMRVLDAKKEKRSQELQNAQVLQDFACQKAESKDTETARLIAKAITSKKVQKATLEKIDQIVSSQLLAQAKSLADVGKYEEASKAADKIPLQDQKEAARDYIKTKKLVVKAKNLADRRRFAESYSVADEIPLPDKQVEAREYIEAKRLVGQAKVLAIKGKYEEAYEVAKKILLHDQKIEALNYVSTAEEEARNKAKAAREKLFKCVIQ